MPLRTDLPNDARAACFLRQFFAETGDPDAFPARRREVEAEFAATGTYRATFAELEFGARVAWRNAVRCIGRLYWHGLAVRGRRRLSHPDDIAQALVEHLDHAFNGGNLRYMGTEIAARNFTDPNRYDLLPEIAERMGLDMSSDRTLWRDKAMILLNEAVLISHDRAGVKMADHHEASHEFLDFCRAEQRAGREPYGRWMWLVPPVSGSATPLYQEPFRDLSFKPAYRYQPPAWAT